MFTSVGNRAYSLASKAVEVARVRTLFVILFFALAFLILIIRLYFVMVFNNDDNGRAIDAIPVATSRADIVDRNNVIIATSLPTVSLYACPHEILDFEEAAEKISNVFRDAS